MRHSATADKTWTMNVESVEAAMPHDMNPHLQELVENHERQRVAFVVGDDVGDGQHNNASA